MMLTEQYNHAISLLKEMSTNIKPKLAKKIKHNLDVAVQMKERSRQK